MILEINWFSENQKAIWDVLSSIGTMLAAIATFVTVREMRRSRRDTFNPDLFIQDKSITIEPSDYTKIVFVEDKFYFELFNLGTGAAKHIRIEWHNNFKERWKSYKGTLFNSNLEETIELKFEPFSFIFPLAFDPEKTSVGFAKGSEEGSSRFHIGDNYIKFLMIEALAKMNQTNEDMVNYNISESINSQLKITYLNTQNKRKTVVHKIKTGVTIFRKDGTLELDSIMFHFNFDPIPIKRS